MLPESLRSRPYLVHTNRELGLMLSGRKPLAAFRWIEGYEVDAELRYLRMFDRHVRRGRFIRWERTQPVPKLPGVLDVSVFYTLPGEEWRVEAYRELFSFTGKWTISHERRQGELLGYTDWQNDFHLQNWKSND